ncbi:hypothetical protein [Flavobacterium ardleyense]|uniref:hypothetical protein n=1 Tax=Flavobacterium ardleyense TaxID=2038737 RepID=UPI00298CC7C4|nr:hypothetical protein [Flavobacterium ardleyense]
MLEINKADILTALEDIKDSLISTHKRLCLPLIIRMYKKMENGIKFDAIKVSESTIVDGHHRYVASVLAGQNLPTIKSATTSATIEYDWKDVEFVEEDWDTPEIIQNMNKADAEYNNMTLDQINEMIK